VVPYSGLRITPAYVPHRQGTSYIGREHDNETDLGFFGVRLYEPEYGRFLSTDVLWGKYLPLQPYQYAGNEPVMALDYGGDSVRFLSDKAENQYNEARSYLVSKYQDASSAFEAVESSTDLVYIQTNSRGENRFIEDEAAGMVSNGDKTVHTVHWDPTASIDYRSEGAISPALVLFHEILHAHGVITGTSASTAFDGSKTTSAEEARVIKQENTAARSLKEGIRTFHDYLKARTVHGAGYGQIKRVKSPKEGGKEPTVESGSNNQNDKDSRK